MTSGILYPCRIASQSRKPIDFGERCATRVVNIMNRAQYHRALKELPLQGYILGIGFGNGNMLEQVLKKGCCSVYGMEVSESYMTTVEWKLLPSLRQGYLRLAMGSTESLPFTSARMDTVYSISTIYFWESLDKRLCEIARILKPQGTPLLVFCDKRFMSYLPLREYSFRLHDPENVKAALKHNGHTFIEVHEVRKEKSYCIRARRGNVQERRT